MKRLTWLILGVFLSSLIACAGVADVLEEELDGGGYVDGDDTGFEGDMEPGEIDLVAILEEEADPDGPAVTVYVSTPSGFASAATGRFEEGGRAASPDDVFRIGSVSKMYTAAATLALVDSGQLSLDDTAADWLDSSVISGIENAEEATVEELLNHTSGIADYLDDYFMDEAIASNRTWQPEQVLEYAEEYDASFAPGNGFEYSNTNYILLQMIVEAASGQPLHTNIRQAVLTPLGLRNTYTQITESGTAPAHGYEDLNGGGLEDVTNINDGAGLGDGGLIASASDVAGFLEGLVLNGEILSDSSRNAMLTEYQESYGLGIELESSPWGPQIGHSGGVLGYESLAYTFPDYDTTIVVLTGSSDVIDLSVIIDEIMNELYP